MILINIKTNLRKFPEDCISCKLSYQDEWKVHVAVFIADYVI